MARLVSDRRRLGGRRRLAADPLTPLGDPTFSDAGLYDVSLTMPPPGRSSPRVSRPVRRSASGALGIESGPVRELLDDRRRFRRSSETVDDIEIAVYVDGPARRRWAPITCWRPRKLSPVYSAAFGTYPYRRARSRRDRAAARSASPGPVSFPATARNSPIPFYVDEEPGRLRFTVAHEIGHQWWGAVVGMDSNDHTFLLEGLTNYLSVVAVERTEGDEAAGPQLLAQCVPLSPGARAVTATVSQTCR